MTSADKILVVDDDQKICKILSISLSSLGYEITLANDGFQALERIESERFDVVLLDLMLPGHSGIEILRHIHEQRAETQVIVLTAYASLETAIEAMRLGAYDYVTKPFDVKTIRSTVRRALEKQRMAASLAAIYDVSREMTLLPGVNQVAAAVLDVIERILEFEICGLGLVDEERGELYWLAVHGAEQGAGGKKQEAGGKKQEAGSKKRDDLYRLPLSGEKGISVAVARSGEPLYVPDTREEPRYVEMGAANRSELAVPLKVKDRVIGVLNVESAEPDAFSPGDVRLLSTLAAQASVAIENTQLREKAQQEIAERKRVEEKLRESEQRLKIKLDRILSPDQEIGDFKLTDIADVETLQQIQDAFAQANGVASVILDLDANPITEESGYCELCHLIRQTVKGKTNCGQSGIVLSEKVAETLEPAWHACQSCGLLEACAPIVVAGKHIANWFIGQSNTLNVDHKRIRDYAEEIGADANAMSAAFDEMPEIPTEKFEHILSLLWQVALELSTSAYNNLKLAKEVYTRKQAEEELGRRNRHLAALQAVAATVGRSLDLDEILHAALDKVLEVTGLEVGGIQLLDESGERLLLEAHRGISETFRRAIAEVQVAGDPLARQVLASNQPLVVSERNEQEWLKAKAEAEGLGPFVQFSLHSAGRILGLMTVQSRGHREFSSEEVALLTTIGDTIGIAIENARLFQASQRRAAELQALYDTSLHLSAYPEPSELLRLIVEQAVALLGAEAGGFYFYDPQRDELTFSVTTGYFTEFVGATLKPGEGLAGKVLDSRHSLVVEDYHTWPGRAAVYEGESRFRATLAVPLLGADGVLGVLDIGGGERKRTFDERDVWLAELFAAQAAVALEHARLHEEEQRRARELAALNQAGRILTSTLDLQEVLTLILNEARSTVSAEAASVLLHDANDDELVFAASDGQASEGLVGARMPADAGIAGWAMQKVQPVLVHDTQDDQRFYDHIDDLTSLTTRSLLAVPLVHKEKVVGVIEAINSTNGDFDRHDLNLLATLADSAAIAIENARLHEETQSHLAEVRVLQEVMLAAASTLDFDLVLTRAIQAIHRTLGIEYLSFALPDESEKCMVVHPSLIGFVPPPEGSMHMPLDRSVTGRVYTTGQPELIDDNTKVPYHFKCTPGLRSELAVPVRVGDRVVAVLNAESPRPAAFSQDDLRILQTIAAQLGIVMENARLYEAEREQRKLVKQSQAQLVRSEKLAATGRLAASLAHEINNPLQAIHNSLQLMLTFPLEPGEQREYLQMAGEEVERLMGMVSRTLDFARPPQREKQPTYLNDVVEKMLALANKYLQHRHVTLRQNLSPGLPAVLATPDELDQVFLNLVLNAVDAMPEGGTLRISVVFTGPLLGHSLAND